jgi:hypothetical protein
LYVTLGRFGDLHGRTKVAVRARTMALLTSSLSLAGSSKQ